MPKQAKQHLSHPTAGKRRLRFEALEDRRVLAALALDAGFGDEGIVRFASVRDGAENGAGEAGEAIVRLPDGKLLVGGTTLNGHGLSLAFARLLPDGSLDPTFGDQGRLNPVLGPDSMWLRDMILLPDGDFLATAEMGNSSYLVRFEADGTLDTSFGDQGVLSDASLGLRVSDVDVQSTGRIILTAERPSGFLLAALTPSGSLDPTFGGGDGLVEDSSFYPYGSQTVIQSGDQIVVAGPPASWMTPYDIQVVRWTPDGSSDSNFGSGGLQTVDWEYDDPFGTSQTLATLDGDDIVLAVKTGDGEISVVRLLAEGGFDASFGDAGHASVPLGTNEWATVEFASLTVDSSGGVILASSSSTSEDYHLVLARLTAGGVIDATFGAGGVVTEPLSYWSGNVGGVTVAGDRIVVGVDVTVPPREASRMGVLQFEADGDLDLAFGDSGQVSIIVSDDLFAENPEDVVVQADGKIVVASTYDIDYRLYRFLQNGGLDTAFGGDGQVDLAEYGVHGSSLALQADGRLLLGGWAFESDEFWSKDATLTRLLPDGSLDTSFGDGGTLTFEEPETTGQTARVEVLADGSIIVVLVEDGEYTVRRVLPSGVVDASFGGGQPVVLEHEAGYADFLDLTLLADGRLQFAFNYLDLNDYDTSVALATMLPNGDWDASYGAGGWAIIENLSHDFTAWTVGWQNNGGVLLAGAGSNFDGTTTVVVRIDASGEVDASFGESGLAIVESSPLIQTLHALDDGRILLVEEIWNGTDMDVVIEALLADGTPDTDFGGGRMTLEVGVYHDIATHAIALSATRLLLVGTVQTEDASPLYLAKVVLSESAWQNPSAPLNVDGDPDGEIVPLDALLIINTLNLDGPRLLTGGPGGDRPYYYDVNGDGWVTALDALMVINWLNLNPIPPGSAGGELAAEGEGELLSEAFGEIEASLWESSEPNERLDGAAVALLMSSLEADQKRR